MRVTVLHASVRARVCDMKMYVQVMQEHGKEIKADAVQASSYVNAVVKEVLRMHPIVPYVPRITRVDLDVDGFHIPKVRLCAHANNHMCHQCMHFPSHLCATF